MPGMEARAPERTETSRVAKLLAGDLFQTLEMLEDVSGDIVIDLTAVCIVLGAGIRSDGEALGHGHTEVGHLGQVGTLAAQQLAHLAVALREKVYEFSSHFPSILSSYQQFFPQKSVPSLSGEAGGKAR